MVLLTLTIGFAIMYMPFLRLTGILLDRQRSYLTSRLLSMVRCLQLLPWNQPLSILTFMLVMAFTNGHAQQVGGPCEGCEAVFEFGSKKLSWMDTLPDFRGPGPKLEISGTIYRADGRTPAKDVILYIYHTDQKGVYPQKGNEKGWAKRHGYLRGWIKTKADGKYKFYTLRPASYPNTRAPQHIHPVIKEPNKNEYYIDEYLFTDDPFLDEKEKANQEKRGGSGVITLKKDKNGMWIGKRDIILGLNIPNYH